MSNTYNTQSQRDYTLLESGIRTQLVNEGTSLKGLDDQIAKITEGYLVVVKCLWSRISDSNVQKFIVDKQDLAQAFVNLLTKYDMDSLVYTFRQRFMNHKTKKVMTSVENLTTYIVDVISGDTKVIAKAIKTKKAPKKSTPKAKALKVVQATPLTNAFITPAKSTTKVVKTPKKTRATKVAPVKVVKVNQQKVDTKVSKSGKSWIQHDIAKLPETSTFLRVNLKNTSALNGDGVDSVFGWFEYLTTDKNNKFVVLRTKLRNDDMKPIVAHIPVQNIASVYKYA
jgi:hypothetical protein